jgi:hypothetical protein
LDVFEHRGDLDLIGGHVHDDVVLPHPDPGHAGQVGQLVAVRIPDFCDVVEMLVRLPEISVIDYAIRPSASGVFGAY